MKLKEVINFFDENDPITMLMGMIQILRSVEQQETATLEGCCASIEKWVKIYGQPTKEKILNWIGETAVPEEVINWAVKENVHIVYPLILIAQDNIISLYDSDGLEICSRKAEDYENVLWVKKMMKMIQDTLNKNQEPVDE